MFSLYLYSDDHTWFMIPLRDVYVEFTSSSRWVKLPHQFRSKVLPYDPTSWKQYTIQCTGHWCDPGGFCDQWVILFFSLPLFRSISFQISDLESLWQAASGWGIRRIWANAVPASLNRLQHGMGWRWTGGPASAWSKVGAADGPTSEEWASGRTPHYPIAARGIVA